MRVGKAILKIGESAVAEGLSSVNSAEDGCLPVQKLGGGWANISCFADAYQHERPTNTSGLPRRWSIPYHTLNEWRVIKACSGNSAVMAQTVANRSGCFWSESKGRNAIACDRPLKSLNCELRMELEHDLIVEKQARSVISLARARM